jgi:PAS domain S-box-containing protein
MMNTKICIKENKHRIIIIIVLVISCFFLIYFFHGIYDTGSGFTHLFYIPILLSCFWYKKKCIIVAGVLGIALIISHIFLRSIVSTYNDYVRALMFIVVAFFISKLTEQLKANQEKFRIIADFTHDWEYWISPEGKYIYVSPSCERITGYKQEEFKKDPELLDKIAFLEDKEIVKKYKIDNNGFKNRISYDFRIVTKSGETRWMGHASQPVYNLKGQYLGLRANNRDITDRKLAEEALKRSEEQLRNLAGHLQSVKEDERASIAREIHDELGQSLTALKMDLVWLENKLPDEKKIIAEKIESMRKMTDMTIQSVKRVLANLRPSIIDDLGLSPAIEWQVEEFKKRTGINCITDIKLDGFILENPFSIALFRIFQEILTNIIRHANASCIEIDLSIKSNIINLQVMDNGKGITDKEINGSSGYGLIGIKERVKFLGGETAIIGKPGEGTVISVKIPLKKEKG